MSAETDVSIEWCCTCRFWLPDEEDNDSGRCQCVRSPSVMDITFHADSCPAWESNK